MSNCDCEFCAKCPSCNHRADEHMAGDLACGICYQCQKESKECGIPTAFSQWVDLDAEQGYVAPPE